jgi:galactokinase
MPQFRAPGRVNLIGDHTDYNEGFVMPMAIQLDTRVAVEPNESRALVLRSDGVREQVRVDLDKHLQRRGDWTDYVIGVAHVLQSEGYPVHGADVSISSTLPQGAGLSSSAALEVATAFALLNGHVPDRVTVARWCQRAENEFVGARCGIMDQYIACLGQPGHALMIDCRSLEHRLVPLPSEVAIVVSNTMRKHSVASGEYNVRREECEEAVRLLAGARRGIRSLRDVSLVELNTHREMLPAKIFQRARHVIAENARVMHAADAFDRRDFARCGELMSDSHNSLRDDFDVSSAELDVMVAVALAQSGVFGSRMTGGGFGGSTVSLVAAAETERVVNALADGYARETGTAPDVYVCVPSAGASRA